jgi:RHH-type transcriptional regulator, rel operon repressor / antitoxin RelB
MTKTMISARVDVELNEKLEALAASTQRSKAFLITEALEALIDKQSWLDERIAEAVKRADESDDRISNESMMAWLDSWGTDSPLTPPEPDIKLNRKRT